MAAQFDPNAFARLARTPGFNVLAPGYGLRRSMGASGDGGNMADLAQAQQQASTVDTGDNSFMLGLHRSIAELPSMYYALKGLGENAVGATTSGHAALEEAAADTAAADKEYPVPVDNISQIHGLGDAGSYAAAKLGGFIPSAIGFAGLGLATGGLGDVGAALGDAGVDAAGSAAADAATSAGLDDAGVAAARQAALDKAGAPVLKGLARRAMVRNFAANTALGTAMNAPNSVPDVLDAKDPQAAAAKGLLGDAAVSAMQAAPITHLFAEAAPLHAEAAAALDGTARDVASKTPWYGRLVKAAAHNAATFGTINTASTAANQLTHAWIMHQPPQLLGPGMGQQYLNALASGAVLGVAMGAMAPEVHGARAVGDATTTAFGHALAAARKARSATDAATDVAASGVATGVDAARDALAPIASHLRKAASAVGGKARAALNAVDMQDVIAKSNGTIGGIASALRSAVQHTGAWTGAMLDRVDWLGIAQKAKDSYDASVAGFKDKIQATKKTLKDNGVTFNDAPVPERAVPAPDPARIARLQNAFSVAVDDPVRAGWMANVAARFLPDSALAKPGITAQIEAYVSALRNGLDSLDAPTKRLVSKFVSSVPDEMGGGPDGAVVRAIAAARALQGRASEAFKAQNPTAFEPAASLPEEGPATALGDAYTEALQRNAAAEPAPEALPDSDETGAEDPEAAGEAPLATVDAATAAADDARDARPFTRGQYGRNRFYKNPGRVPENEGVTMQSVNAQGAPYTLRANVPGMVADTLTNPAYRDPSPDDRTRLLNAFHTAMGQAQLFGDKVDPSSIQPGLVLARNAAPLTADEAAQIRAMYAQPATPYTPEERGPAPSATPGIGNDFSTVGDPVDTAQGAYDPSSQSSALGPRQTPAYSLDAGRAASDWAFDRLRSQKAPDFGAFVDGDTPAPTEKTVFEPRTDGAPLSREERAASDRQLEGTLRRALGAAGLDPRAPLQDALEAAFRKGRAGRFAPAINSIATQLADGDPRMSQTLDLARARATLLDHAKVAPDASRPRNEMLKLARNVLKDKYAVPSVKAAAHTVLDAADQTDTPERATRTVPVREHAGGTNPFDNQTAASNDERPPAAPPKTPTLRDTIARVTNSRAFKEISDEGQRLVKSESVQPEAAQAWVDHLAHGFGLQGITYQQHAHDSAGRNGWYDPDTRTISVSSQLKGAAHVATIAHEIGHAVVHEHFDQTTPEVKEALQKDWKNWVEQQRAAPARGGDEVRASRAPIFSSMKLFDAIAPRQAQSLGEMSEANREYLMSFPEYMADHIARVLTAPDSPTGAITRFFQRLGRAMGVVHSIARSIMGKSVEAPQSVRDFVARMWSPERNFDDMAAGGAGDKSAFQEPGPNAVADAVPPVPDGVNRPEGAPDPMPMGAFMQLDPASRRAAYEFVSRPEIVRQVIEHLPDLERSVLFSGTQSETLVNAAAALHAEGKLNLTKSQSLSTLFDNLVDMGRRRVGMPSQRDYGRFVLAKFKASGGALGSLEKPFSIYTDYRNNEARGWQKPILDVQQKLRTFNQNVSQRFLGAPVKRVHQWMVPALQELMARTHQTSGEQSNLQDRPYIMANDQARSQWLNRADHILHGVSKDDQLKLHEALAAHDDSALTPALRDKAMQLRAFYQHFHRYLTDAGVRVGKAKNPYGVVIDPAQVNARSREFKDLLASPNFQAPMKAVLEDMNKRAAARNAPAPFDVASMTPEDIQNTFFHMAAHSPDVHGPMGTMLNSGMRPGFREAHPRVSQFIFDHGTKDQIDQFNSFRSKDLAGNIGKYIRRGTRRAEFARAYEYTDENGKSHSRVADLLHKAKRQGATDYQIKYATDMMDHVLGTKHYELNPLLKRAFHAIDYAFDSHLSSLKGDDIAKAASVIGAYQNVRLLWLNTLNSLVDPLGNWVRTGGNVSLAWNGFRDAARAVRGKDNGALRSFAEGLGTLQRHGMTEALAHTVNVGDDNESSLANRFNTALFKFNGMDFFTKFNRMAATSTANRFLLYHQALWTPDSERYFNELGLKRSDVQRDERNPAFVKLTPKVEHAIFRFVNEANINPTAVDAPLWFRDPHFTLLAQYKNYTYTMYHQISERMVHEIAWGNVRGAIPAAGYLGATAAGEMLKSMITYGSAAAPAMANAGPTDYLKHLFAASALGGPGGSIGLNTANSFMSPTRAQLGEIAGMVEGRTGVGKVLTDAMPGSNVWGHWFERAGVH